MNLLVSLIMFIMSSLYGAKSNQNCTINSLSTNTLECALCAQVYSFLPDRNYILNNY